MTTPNHSASSPSTSTTTSTTQSFNGGAQDVINAALRFSSAADIENVLNFYKGNRHQHVHIRDEALLASRVRDGHFLILQDKDTGEVLASSGSYDYTVTGDTDRASYAEIGSTRFSDKVAGFGLYPLFIASQVVHGMLGRPPKKMYIANVYDDSPVGREMLTKKVGWNVINATPDIIETFLKTKDPSTKGDMRPMTWYGSPASCLPHESRVILGYLATPQIKHKKLDCVLNIDMSGFDLANKYNPHLKSLASGQWDSLMSDEHGKNMLDLQGVSAMLHTIHNTGHNTGFADKTGRRYGYKPS